MTKKQKNQQQSILTKAYVDYEKGLNAFAFFKLSDPVVGRDLVQDTFMKTWKYLAKGGKIDLMKAFLYHILNNLIIDEYRKRKHTTTSLEVLIERGSEPSADSENITDILDEKSALLLIKRLPKRYQKVMHMRYVQDLSIGDVSELTKETRNSIAVQTHRGLEKLKLLYHSQPGVVSSY